VLPDLRRTFHAVSNADANVLFASGSSTAVFGNIGITAPVSACVVSPICDNDNTRAEMSAIILFDA
jgi:hypothetical protein